MGRKPGICTLCKKEDPYGDDANPYRGPAWWTLNNYHGISGYFCPECYDKVDWWNGEPRNPEAYRVAFVQLTIQRSNA